MAIDTVVQRVGTVVGAVTGIAKAHDYPPDSINQSLQAVVYPTNILWQYGITFGRKHVTFDVVIELYHNAPDQARTIKALVPFADSIPLALFADEFLNSTVQQWGDITGEFVDRRANEGQLLLQLILRTCEIDSDL